MTNKIIIGLLIALVISIGMNGYSLYQKGFGAGSGFAHYQHESFLQGLSGGARDQFSVSNVGVLTSTAAMNLSGAVANTGTSKVGSSGTAQSNQIATTCNLIANESIAATSTGLAHCSGVTGVTVSDLIFAQFGTSTTFTVADQWLIMGAEASSTAGAIDIELLNLTGAAAVPSAASTVGSSTRIWGVN